MQIPGTKPQRYHEEGCDKPDATWELFPMQFEETICFCVGEHNPDTCPKYTTKCEWCEKWLEADGYLKLDEGVVYCEDCVSVVVTMPIEEGKEYFCNADCVGTTRVFYKHHGRGWGGRQTDEPDFEDPYCGECAKHDHYLFGYRYFVHVLEEGRAEECGGCTVKMFPAYGDPDCWVCGGATEVIMPDDSAQACPECSGGEKWPEMDDEGRALKTPKSEAERAVGYAVAETLEGDANGILTRFYLGNERRYVSGKIQIWVNGQALRSQDFMESGNRRYIDLRHAPTPGTSVVASYEVSAR